MGLQSPHATCGKKYAVAGTSVARGQRRVVAAVAQHLLCVVLVVADGDVGDVALLVGYCLVARVYKAFVGGKVEPLVAFEYLGVEGGVYLDGVGLDQCPGGFKVAGGLDALHLGQQLGKEVAHFGIVVHLHVGLAVALYHLDHVAVLAVLVHPPGR